MVNDVLFVELSHIFNITKVVFVVRFLPEQAMSGYRFSGWLNRDLTDIVRDNESSIFNALSRHAKSISRFSNLYSTFLCPLEAPDLLNRFCETCFDQSPLPIEASSYSGKVSVNKSIGLGFADALRNEVVSRGLSFKGFDRRRIVRLAKRWKLPKEISELMPSAYIVDQLAKGIDSISGYKSLA